MIRPCRMKLFRLSKGENRAPDPRLSHDARIVVVGEAPPRLDGLIGVASIGANRGGARTAAGALPSHDVWSRTHPRRGHLRPHWASRSPRWGPRVGVLPLGRR